MAKTLYEVEVDIKGTVWASVWAESPQEARDKAIDAAFAGDEAFITFEVTEAEVVDLSEEFDQDDEPLEDVFDF